MRIFCTAKDSHIFPTKNNSGFVIFTFLDFNETFTNDVVNVEQLAPGFRWCSLCTTIYSVCPSIKLVWLDYECNVDEV